jgi:hypothetical protein
VTTAEWRNVLGPRIPASPGRRQDSHELEHEHSQAWTGLRLRLQLSCSTCHRERVKPRVSLFPLKGQPISFRLGRGIMRFSARSPSPSPVRRCVSVNYSMKSPNHSYRRRSLSYGLQSSSYSSSSSEAGDSHTDSSSESDEYSSDASESLSVAARAVRRTSHPSTSSSSWVLS